MAPFFAKGMHSGLCHLRSPMHSPSCSWVPAPCSSSGSQWHFYSLWSFCKKPPGTHLLPTICSISIPRVWLRFVVPPLPTPGCQLALVFRTAQTCFGILSNLFEISPVNHGKSNSGGPVNSGSSPPGVHQTGWTRFRLNLHSWTRASLGQLVPRRLMPKCTS